MLSKIEGNCIKDIKTTNTQEQIPFWDWNSYDNQENTGHGQQNQWTFSEDLSSTKRQE